MSEICRTADKLGVNKYKVDERSHIVLSNAFYSRQDKMKIVRICPAGLYSLDENDRLVVSHLGCLECGACRALGIGKQLKSWEYPESGYGVEYRQG